MSVKKSLLILLAAVFLIAGCSDQDDLTYPENTGQQLSALLRGQISRDQVDFEFAAKISEGMDDPAPGTLLVRGRNLAYDADLGAVTVDLSVYNDSDNSYPEPVGLTFMQFMPAEVTIGNPDNDQNGVGALIRFEFEDDDLSWSPGEESQSRMVQFIIPSGTSFGFVARIDVGLAPEGGTIGGMVWHDEDEDGDIDPEEEGVGGVTMALHAGDDVSVNPLTTVITAEDGTYRFESQEAGYYTVVRMPQEGLVGTTPPEMAVILVEMDGTVSDFLLANFGVKAGDEPGDDFVKVGDYVHAKGWYQAESDRLVARIFDVCPCDDEGNKHDSDDGDDDDDDDDGDDDDGDDDCDDCDDDDGDDGDHDDDCDDCHDDDDCCPDNNCWGRLAGPVTGFDMDERYLEIMGTKVYFAEKDGHHDEYHMGVRFRVDASRDPDMNDGKVMACRLPKWWNGNRDRVKGYVQEIVRGDDDRITGVIILNTLVEVPLDAVNR